MKTCGPESKEEHIKDPSACKQLIDSIRSQMDLGENAYQFENRTSVVLVIGVDRMGKTTSIGKLAGQMKEMGGSCWRLRIRSGPRRSNS